MHKWLNTTYDSAVAIVRTPSDMVRTFHVGAPYVAETSRIDPLSRGIEMSQRARAIETWAVLKSLGIDGVAAQTERFCDLARRFAEALETGGVAVINDVVLNQVLVRLGEDDATSELLAQIQASGVLWASGSSWQSRPAVRLSVCGWATTANDIDRAAAEIVGIAAQI